MNKHDKSMWDKVAAMPDSQSLANAMADLDNTPTDAIFWADEDVQKPDTRTIPIHIRVASDVLNFFKKGGPGYQTRISRVLEQYVNWQQQR